MQVKVQVNDTGVKFATGINVTDGKFTTGTAGVGDTSGKLATGVNNTGGKLPRVLTTGGKFASGVNDTGSK